MRLLKLPGGAFNELVYTGPTSLLALDIASTGWGTRLWDLSSDAPPVVLTPAQVIFATLAFRHGGLPFLRTHGFWPADAPLPNAEEQARLLKVLGTNARPAWKPFAFAPDAATVLFVHTGRIDETYQTHFYLRSPDGAVHDMWRVWGMFTTSAAFSPNGRLVAMSNGMRAVAVWDVATRKELCQLEQSDKVNDLAFTSDDRLIVAAGRSVRLWDTTTGKPLTKYRAFRKYVDAVAVSHDRRLFATGCRDGLVRVWDSASGRELSEYEWPVGEVRALAFSPDGATAAVAGVGTIAVWDID